MTYSAGISALSRKKTVIVKLNLDSETYWITLGDIPYDQGYKPCVNDIEWIPTRAAVSGGLGYFGEIVIRAKDFPFNQDGAQGSYFGRMIADNTYYLNRLIDVYVGFYEFGDTFNLSNFQKRTYFLKRIDGPDDRGRVSFYASDVISRLKEAEVPVATDGNLNASITDSTTGTINITDNTGFSNTGGYATIDDEIVSYTGTSGSDSITGVVRAQGGTKAESHDANAPVRDIYNNNANVVDVIRDIIEDFSDIDHATYLPDADWNTEKSTYLASETVDLWVTEPTSLDKVISQLAMESFINVWWDDANQEIKLQALGPSLSSSVTWTDDDNILDQRITIKRDQKKILTTIYYFFNKIDKTGGNDANNFENVYLNSRTSLETALGEERIKKIYAETIPSAGGGTAAKVTGRIIDQNEIPIEFTCLVDAKDSTVDIGDAVTIETDLIQDSVGGRLPTIMRVIEKAERDNNQYHYKLIKTGQETGDRYAVIGPNTLNDYASESTSNRDNYGFISDNDPDMSNGDDPYLIL